MGTLVAAYAVAWAVVSAYVTTMTVRHRRLSRRLDELEALLREQSDGVPAYEFHPETEQPALADRGE